MESELQTPQIRFGTKLMQQCQGSQVTIVLVQLVIIVISKFCFVSMTQDFLILIWCPDAPLCLEEWKALFLYTSAIWPAVEKHRSAVETKIHLPRNLKWVCFRNAPVCPARFLFLFFSTPQPHFQGHIQRHASLLPVLKLLSILYKKMRKDLDWSYASVCLHIRMLVSILDDRCSTCHSDIMFMNSDTFCTHALCLTSCLYKSYFSWTNQL